jgi:hypothetical protein
VGTIVVPGRKKTGDFITRKSRNALRICPNWREGSGASSVTVLPDGQVRKARSGAAIDRRHPTPRVPVIYWKFQDIRTKIGLQPPWNARKQLLNK